MVWRSPRSRGPAWDNLLGMVDLACGGWINREEKERRTEELYQKIVAEGMPAARPATEARDVGEGGRGHR